jgi:hypothetical protein
LISKAIDKLQSQRSMFLNITSHPLSISRIQRTYSLIIPYGTNADIHECSTDLFFWLTGIKKSSTTFERKTKTGTYNFLKISIWQGLSSTSSNLQQLAHVSLPRLNKHVYFPWIRKRPTKLQTQRS